MIHFQSSQQPVPGPLKHQLDEAWQRLLKRPEIGFPRIPERDQDWQAIEARVSVCKPAQHILVLGIGGSSLGTQVLSQAFGQKAKAQLHFLESPDPHIWSSLGGMKGEEWKDKHIVIVSKSGNTLETLAWVERLAASDPHWLKNSQVTVIASPGEGPLQKWAKAKNISCLWIPTEVGGRFSVLTAVSMFPAALMGLDIKGFREGSRWALQHLDLSTALSAEILAGWKRGEWITQLWTYSENLRVFGEWWQQLWGESLAKKITRQNSEAPRVSTPMACVGPRDQHSLVQQLMEGAKDKQVFITRVLTLENSTDTFHPSIFPDMAFQGRDTSLGQIVGAEAQAFERSLKESGIHSATINVEMVNEKSLGALFMLWQMVTGQLGEHLGIDAFNQPGVEIGKKYATQILRG